VIGKAEPFRKESGEAASAAFGGFSRCQFMKKYKTFVRGENFLINIDGKEQKLGFYTTVFVEAKDEEDAEQRSIQLLRDDKKLRESTLNKKSDSPTMCVEEIEELESFDGFKLSRVGFSFFPMEQELGGT
jgi:hypothetical protein